MLPALKSGDEGGLFGFEFRVGYELEKLRPAILMHWAVPKRKQFTGLPDVGT
jgi:hypothetical protein